MGSDHPRSEVSHAPTSARFLRQRLDKDLRAATPTQFQVQGAFLLDAVTRQQPAILECCSETRRCWSGGMPSLPWIFAFIMPVVSGASTSDTMISRRKSARHLAGTTPDAGGNPSGCRNPTIACHPRVSCLWDQTAALAGCPPCLGSPLSRCRKCLTPQSRTRRFLVSLDGVCMPPCRRNTRCRGQSFWMS